MRVTVFGATETIGREVVTDLLFRGHEVVAYLPSSEQAPDEWGEGVDVVVGKLTDVAAVDTAVTAGEAVINALDPRLLHPGSGLSLVQGTGHIVASMQRHGIDRYIGYGTPAIALCPREQPTTRARMTRFVTRCFRPRAYRQMREMLEIVTGSGLDWTLVRFMHTKKDGKGHGLKHVGLFGQDDIGYCATEADIARFSASQVVDTRYIGAAPAVSS